MALVAKSSPEDTHKLTSEIIQFFKEGENAIRISQKKDVVLVLGVTGAGKTTLTQFLTSNDDRLEGVEQGEDSADYIIIDQGHKVCKETTESCTTIPDLFVDRKTETPFYDSPGFVDTRHVKHDLSVTYFIKKIIDSVDSVKLLFTVSYPAVRSGVDRQNFMLLVKNAVTMIKDIDKFKDSIALIVTKVDNHYIVKSGKAPFLVPDKNIINNIASFLNEVKRSLMAKMSQLSDSQYVDLAKAVQFIDVLLSKNGEDYVRIGIFRRPDDSGRLITPLMLDNRKSLERIVHQNLDFTHCDTGDFGYTVSAESINTLHGIVEQVNNKITLNIESIAKEIEEGFLVQERDVSDLENLYKKFHFGFEALQNITSAKSEDPRDFLMRIRQAASVLSIDVSRQAVDSVLHYDRFLKFVGTLSSIPTAMPLQWAEGLTSVVQSFDDSQKWYYFLINLRATLLKHDIQQKLSKNSTAMDSLRKQVQLFANDDAAVKEDLRQFLAQVFGDSDREFNSVKTAKLNSWKLKFLKTMLDFQVLTSCLDNKLVVVGNYVHLSDVAQKECDDAKFVEIFALSKLFIDANYDRTGSKLQVSMLAPVWEVIGSPTIVLDGESGLNHMIPTAMDGDWPGDDGNDGLPGLPGGAAGNFLGFGWNCINCQFLTVLANGGQGGRGQNGGNGKDGKDGVKPTRPNDSKNLFNIGIVRVSHETKEANGQNGGNGGRGGVGGMGGEKGKVSIFMFDTSPSNLPKSSQLDGGKGRPGKGGKGGSGGTTEQVVESNTYLFGWNAWSNGIVAKFFSSAFGGTTQDQYNDKSIEHPEEPVDLVNPSRAVNHYKAYLRENLDRSLSRMSLEEFLEQLETSKEIRDLYDTLGLVNDLQVLESQYTKLHHRIPLLPFYKSLLDKIEAYARDRPFAEITGQHRKVRAYLYLSTLSKICTIDNNLNNDLVINVKEFLGTIVKDVNQLLKGFMVAKHRNDERAVYQKKMTTQIVTAYKFIKEDISIELQNILAELDGEISALISETQRLQNITRQELKKLNEHMLSRAVSSVLRVAARALDFFGLIGLAAEGVIESSTLLSETLSLDGNSPLNVLGTLPKTIEDFFSSMSSNFQEKVKDFVTRLFDVDKLFRDGAQIPALNETRSVLQEARQKYESYEASESLDEEWDDVIDRRSQLVDFLQSQKKSLEKNLQDDPNLGKALEVLDRSEQILKLPEGVYKTLKKNRVEESKSGELEANEKLLQLEAYEEKIYHVIIPLCTKLKQLFNPGAFDRISHAALDVQKWKVQNALRDISSHILAMADGFQVEGAMAATVEKLKFGISTTIQVYDRIQDYRDQAALADYLAEITSSAATDIKVTDRDLSDAIDDLQVILKTNLILADYEMAMNAFGQHVFPFVKTYMAEYDLPASLKPENSTDDLLSEAIYRINSIERKLTKSDLVISKHLDDHFFPDVDFNGKSPLYVWKYETAVREIDQLLLGKEVILHADVTRGLPYNAVKFNEIGIRFNFANKASQFNFDRLIENFTVEMNHLGMSYYRCGTKFYVMTHDNQKIAHSVNTDNVGQYSRCNAVYDKLSKNEPLLSPYTMWKVKLHNVSASFDVLTNFTNEIIDLSLEGHGMFVDREIDQTVCTDRLDNYYKLDETVIEVPAIDYRVDAGEEEETIDYRIEPVDEPPSRRRRGAESETNNGGYGLFSPLKSFIQWYNGRENTPPLPVANDEFLQSNDRFEYDDNTFDHPFEYAALGADSSQPPLTPVNYNLVASQNNLLLLDLLMRLKTGAKRSSATKNLDFTDGEYAQNMAYSAYAPEKDK